MAERTPLPSGHEDHLQGSPPSPPDRIPEVIWKGGERPDVGLAGVGVAPGVDFVQAGERAVWFSYASSEESLRDAARRLGEYLGKRCGRFGTAGC